MEYTVYAARKRDGMGEPVPLGRACGLCGEQVILSVETEYSDHTDDLGGLLQASSGDGVLIEAQCGCATPRRVALEGATYSSTSVVSDG